MKLKSYLLAALTAATVCTTSTSYAGYYVKKQPTAITNISTTAAAEPAPAATPANAPAHTAQDATTTHKKNLWSKATNLLRRAKLDLVVYVILCILPLGWLAMGINDDFQGYMWLLSLLLYILFYLPGVIFSLVMMSRYY